MSLDGTFTDFIRRWVAGSLGRKTKEASMSVSQDGPVSTIWSYAVPIASIYNGRYALVSDREALSRTSLTTNKHLRRVELEVGSRLPDENIGHVSEGQMPTNEMEWQHFLVGFDARGAGREWPRFHGEGDEAPPFISTRERTAFDEKVDSTLRAYGFEPGLSPIAEKWTRMGRRTVLVARIHSWSPHLVEFYLEGAGDSRTGPGRLIEAGRSDEKTFRSTANKFVTMQDRLEGAGAQGLAGVDDEMCESCDIGAHERCTGCGCGYCLPKREDAPGEQWNYKELALGIQAELEHTDNKHIAMQIAKDHLREDPRYYTKLLKAGL